MGSEEKTLKKKKTPLFNFSIKKKFLSNTGG